MPIEWRNRELYQVRNVAPQFAVPGFVPADRDQWGRARTGGLNGADLPWRRGWPHVLLMTSFGFSPDCRANLMAIFIV
jgi:hypothetical protein